MLQPPEPTPDVEPPLLDEDTACTQTSVAATQVSRPVDIVFVIDNSSSMTEEIEQIQRQINRNFASIIKTAGIDYRVAVLSAFGNLPDPEAAAPFPDTTYWRPYALPVCISEPLGTGRDPDGDGRCEDVGPMAPTPSTERFLHIPVIVDSLDGACRLIHHLDGGVVAQRHFRGTGKNTDFKDIERDLPSLRSFLRPEAQKIIVFTSDEYIRCSMDTGRSIATKTTPNDPSIIGQRPFPMFDRTDNSLSQAGQQNDVAEKWEAALQAAAPELFGATPESRSFSVWSIVGMAPYNASPDKPEGVPAPPDATVAPVIENPAPPQPSLGGDIS